MSIGTLAKRIWAVVRVASVLAWLFSLGLGSIVSAFLASFVDLAQPWLLIFFIGILLMLVSITMPFAQFGFAALGQHLRPKAALTNRQASQALKEAMRAQHLDDLRRKNRARIHEVMTTLESHKVDIQRYMQARTPKYQGQWPENRHLLAEDPRYDRAVRATERAFNAIPYLVGQAAIDPLDEALAELQAVLDEDESDV